MSYPYLPLETVEEFANFLPESDFLTAYRLVKGDPDLMSDRWDDRRKIALDREVTMIKIRGAPLWRDGEPTARHLRLIAWAYSPHAKRVIG